MTLSSVKVHPFSKGTPRQATSGVGHPRQGSHVPGVMTKTKVGVGVLSGASPLTRKSASGHHERLHWGVGQFKRAIFPSRGASVGRGPRRLGLHQHVESLCSENMALKQTHVCFTVPFARGGIVLTHQRNLILCEVKASLGDLHT